MTVLVISITGTASHTHNTSNTSATGSASNDASNTSNTGTASNDAHNIINAHNTSNPGAASNTAGLGGNTGNARQNQQQLCILPEIAAGQGKNDGHFHLLAAYTIPKLIEPTQLVLPKVPF